MLQTVYCTGEKCRLKKWCGYYIKPKDQSDARKQGKEIKRPASLDCFVKDMR